MLTAGRADYGIYWSVLKAIEAHPNLALKLMVVGTHVQEQFGETEDQILADGFEVASYRPLDFINSKNLDWLVVLGDTLPMLESSILAAMSNIPIAHIHGGDRTGSVDESIRHAITRFAHLHFPSLPEHAERLRKTGEEDWRITEVGPLGIYAMPETVFKSREELTHELGLDSRPVAIIIQHPVLQHHMEAAIQMRETLDAVLVVSELQPIVFCPNSDIGSEAVIRVIEAYPVKQFKSLSYPTFLSLMKVASVMVGNSSSAIVEAPLFGLPVVNVGTRQQGRKQYGNVQNVGYHKEEIEQAIRDCLSRSHGVIINPLIPDGPKRIVERLATEEVNERLMQKSLTY